MAESLASSTPAPFPYTVQHLRRDAASLLLYQAVLQSEPGRAFLTLLQHLHERSTDELACLTAYGQWFSALAAAQQTWQAHLLTQILKADNPFTQQAQAAPLTELPASLIAAAGADLTRLQRLYSCTGAQISQWVQAIAPRSEAPIPWGDSLEDGSLDPADSGLAIDPSSGQLPSLPIWNRLQRDRHWAKAIPDLAAFHRQGGVGKFAEYRALRWQAGQLVGIPHPDPIRLDQLAGYEHQRQTLVQNTEALLRGYPALHVLLYGSRGSGKSSLVKALLNQYGDRGLRLIEVGKADLHHLAEIVEPLRHQPLAFILFVDDLSFEEDDDAFKSLKVVLEGSVTARPRNMVVYATSNRRHLIREFHGDRPRPQDADEIHTWDTVQEKLSFGDRFGLTLTFEPADQPTYLDIVRHLATQTSISLTDEQLTQRALQWATRHNGRSGRTARQFIDYLQAEQGLTA
ncbi:MAG: ATP-binding protein [Synechococcales bacterium]|nr:ATP-binding protein [Synechococcales bacterium]